MRAPAAVPSCRACHHLLPRIPEGAPASLLRCAAVALVLGGCGNVGTLADAITIERDSAGIVIVENHPDASDAVCALTAEPRVDIGVAEGSPEYQLYRVFDAATLSDGRIAVVNQGSDEIRFYDARGRYVGAFGRAGGGPGEFRRVVQLWVLAGDTLGSYSAGWWGRLGPPELRSAGYPHFDAVASCRGKEWTRSTSSTCAFTG